MGCLWYYQQTVDLRMPVYILMLVDRHGLSEIVEWYYFLPKKAKLLSTQLWGCLITTMKLGWRQMLSSQIKILRSEKPLLSVFLQHFLNISMRNYCGKDEYHIEGERQIQSQCQFVEKHQVKCVNERDPKALGRRLLVYPKQRRSKRGWSLFLNCKQWRKIGFS